MNSYANEDIMWQRLKDMQLEAENSRLFAQHTLPRLLHLLERVWLLAGLATRRAPRRSALRVVRGDREAADRAA